MGQVVDLPDPLHNDAPAAGPGVDDLLAQLAGEEIDRLLAEADIERPAPPTLLPPLQIRPSHPSQSPFQTASPRPPSPKRMSKSWMPVSPRN